MQLPSKRGARSFSFDDFPARQLPEPGEEAVSRAPGKQNFALPAYYRERPDDILKSTRSPSPRRLDPSDPAARSAAGAQWTSGALRLARRAEHCAEFHQSLIEIPRARRRQKLGRAGAHFAQIGQIEISAQ